MLSRRRRPALRTRSVDTSDTAIMHPRVGETAKKAIMDYEA